MIIPVGYAHIQHFFSGAGLPNGAAVTYGVGGFGSGSAVELAEAMHNVFAVNWLPRIMDTARLEATRAKFGPNAFGPFATWTEPLTGGGLGPQAAPNIALLVEKVTASGGRSGRGRCYIPAINEEGVRADGSLLGSDLAAFQTIVDEWLVDIEANTSGMFLFHAASSDPTKVTKLNVDPKVATQRRRLR